jgi:hypothetical protein
MLKKNNAKSPQRLFKIRVCTKKCRTAHDMSFARWQRVAKEHLDESQLMEHQHDFKEKAATILRDQPTGVHFAQAATGSGKTVLMLLLLLLVPALPDKQVGW